MATRIGGIGTSGDVLTYFKTPRPLGIQLEAGEYPSGQITFPNIVGGGARWRNGNYGVALAIWLCLCDSAGNNKVRIATFTVPANGTSYQNTWTVSGAQALAGKALYLIMEDSGYDWDTRDYTALQSWSGCSLQTEYNNHSIGGVGATGGSFSLNKYTAATGETVTYTASPDTGYTANAPTTSPAVTVTSAGTNKWSFVMPNSDISVYARFTKNNYTVSKTTTPSGGGSASLSKTTATYGEQITVTPSPATGWRVKTITTSPACTVTNNKFTMPASNITVTVTFEKIPYSITKSSSPAAGGTVTTNKITANYGDTVTISQTPSSGYYFNGWTTNPAVTIANGQFTMPNGNISIVANYLKYSTANVNTKSLTSGGTVRLTISPDKSTYSHKYKLSFGAGMETSLTSVAAGTTVVDISVPDSWAEQIPNISQKTGGTLIVETYNGSTKIGTYTISGFSYNVRATALPTLGTITKSIVRTVNGTTYANVGDYYVQNKSAVNVQAAASGALGSTISTMTVTLSGYTGAAYGGSVSGGSLNWTSGLLTISGTITITVTATDSRGRTVTGTATFTVEAYSRPGGTLAVRRVDANGDDDVLGTYAAYEKTSSYTSIGSNSMTVKIKSQGSEATNPADSGDLLPGSGNRQTFSQLNEYSIELELTDAFETVSIIVKLPTAQLMIALGPDGTRMAFMKAVNDTLSPGAGKTGVLEFSDTVQIYIGTTTLEQYIRDVINNS